MYRGKRWLTLGIVGFLLLGCTWRPPWYSPPEAIRTVVVYTYYVYGQLFVEDGCLRVQPEAEPRSFHLLWPEGYTVDVRGNTVRI